MKPSITIYGLGYVGTGVATFLKRHYVVQAVDPVPNMEKADGLGIKIYTNASDASPTPFAVVCVPTPMSEDGACDTSIVEEVLRKTDHEHYLIKSTVIPGTTERLKKVTKKNIVFSPEYLGEGNYQMPFWKGYPHPTDMTLHSFHIFGGAPKHTQKWVDLWQRIAGWDPEYRQTDSTTAELVKYMENAFLATKKIFCDEFYEIAQAMDVNYSELRELWLLDGRMGRSMTLIYPDSRGFGGKCLPKDVIAIAQAAKKAGYTPGPIDEVWRSNKKFRKEERED